MRLADGNADGVPWEGAACNKAILGLGGRHRQRKDVCRNNRREPLANETLSNAPNGSHGIHKGAVVVVSSRMSKQNGTGWCGMKNGFGGKLL